jgi:hypothetical protein
MTPQGTQRRAQRTQGPIVSLVPFLVFFVVKKNLAIRRILFLIMFLSCQVSYAQIKIAYDQNSAPITFGIKHLQDALQKTGQQVIKLKPTENANIVLTYHLQQFSRTTKRRI